MSRWDMNGACFKLGRCYAGGIVLSEKMGSLCPSVAEWFEAPLWGCFSAGAGPPPEARQGAKTVLRLHCTGLDWPQLEDQSPGAADRNMHASSPAPMHHGSRSRHTSVVGRCWLLPGSGGAHPSSGNGSCAPGESAHGASYILPSPSVLPCLFLAF
ncbi:unnamed protein product [Clonostachys chloroleuca]|uniref:Uncharacterized protein n=1 Tax=Clonostachys chloroleuca TaxID=1926264 RepID=A0AA35QB24_9HYPO|nr:unnamed protein product [Clonostachys chloroleuca]